jgi:hypothetical protein
MFAIIGLLWPEGLITIAVIDIYDPESHDQIWLGSGEEMVAIDL